MTEFNGRYPEKYVNVTVIEEHKVGAPTKIQRLIPLNPGLKRKLILRIRLRQAYQGNV